MGLGWGERGERTNNNIMVSSMCERERKGEREREKVRKREREREREKGE